MSTMGSLVFPLFLGCGSELHGAGAFQRVVRSSGCDFGHAMVVASSKQGNGNNQSTNLSKRFGRLSYFPIISDFLYGFRGGKLSLLSNERENVTVSAVEQRLPRH
jgi:hypothetical protein